MHQEIQWPPAVVATAGVAPLVTGPSRRKAVNNAWNTTALVQVCADSSYTIWNNHILNICSAFLRISLKQVTEKIWKDGTSLCPWLCHQSAESSIIILFSAKARLLEAKVDPSPMATQHRRSIWIKVTQIRQIWVRHTHAYHLCSAELLNRRAISTG